MVQVFAKRFWGFDPKLWPIIAFGLEGNRDALIKESRPGDMVAFLGTQRHPTAPEDRGRLLGLAEIGRLPVDTLQVLRAGALSAEDYSPSGEFKWPKSLLMLRAWRFPERPGVKDVLKKQLSYEATVRAVLLDIEDQAAVLAQWREEVEVADVESIRGQRALNEALAHDGPSLGPAPSTWSGQASRDASVASTTYALRFGRRNLWKIGHAQNVTARVREVNKHVPHEVLCERWSEVYTQSWPTQTAAYDMEQRVLTLLETKRTEGERIACTAGELDEV